MGHFPSTCVTEKEGQVVEIMSGRQGSNLRQPSWQGERRARLERSKTVKALALALAATFAGDRRDMLRDKLPGGRP